MDLSFVLTLLVILVLVCGLHMRYSRWGRLLTKIPGHTDWPIFGDALRLALLNRESSFLILRTWRRKLGPIYRLKGLWIAAVNICSAEDIEKIYSSPAHTKKLGMPYKILNSWLCEGLLISNGEKWKHRRKLLTPAFHFNTLKKFCVTFIEQTERLLKNLETEIGKERTDIVPLITKTTFSIMCEASMGLQVKEGNEVHYKTYFESLHDICEILFTRLVSIWYHFDCVYKFSSLARKDKELAKILHNFTDNIITKRIALLKDNEIEIFDDEDDEKNYVGRKRLAMLDLLLEYEKEGKIDRKGIREEVDTFLFEGHDTSSAALAFMLMRIANEPKIQDNIYEELVEIFGDSQCTPSQNDLSKMKYLERCIKESLRIYPPVFFVARNLTEDVVLSGYTVPSGTIIQCHIYDLHHDPKYFPDPEKFDPDRFLTENSVDRHPFAYIPFSAGPRNCIGQKFAMLELKTVMSGVLRRFRLEPVTRTEDIQFQSDIVLRSNHPLYVRFRPRNNPAKIRNMASRTDCN